MGRYKYKCSSSVIKETGKNELISGSTRLLKEWANKVFQSSAYLITCELQPQPYTHSNGPCVT